MSFPNLKLGSTGQAVLLVEKKLAKLGYLKGGADQTFDKKTAKAVVAFKADNGWEDPKPIVRERMADALNIQAPKDGFDKGEKTPKKMNGGSYNCEIGRNPKVVADNVEMMLKHNKLDFLQLQEISGYDQVLEKIPGYKLITFPGTKDRGETGVLVRDDIKTTKGRPIEADSGWVTDKKGHPFSQPRASTSVKVAGWLQVVSVHAPPGLDWVNGHPTGGRADRIKSYQSLTRNLLEEVKRVRKNDPDTAILIGGDWNEGAATGGPGSPSWLAERAGLRKHANGSIDWEMSKGLKFTGKGKGGTGGGDHKLVLFTVAQKG